MVTGRPTKYNSEFPAKVEAFMKEGYSIVEICLELNICKQTFYNWCEEHEAFLDSKKKGVDFSEGWWMKQGRENLKKGDFNYTGWYMNMKNRFGWADKTENKDTIEDKAALLKLLPDKERAIRIK